MPDMFKCSVGTRVLPPVMLDFGIDNSGDLPAVEEEVFHLNCRMFIKFHIFFSNFCKNKKAYRFLGLKSAFKL
jgi:hypothetical protein